MRCTFKIQFDPLYFITQPGHLKGKGGEAIGLLVCPMDFRGIQHNVSNKFMMISEDSIPERTKMQPYLQIIFHSKITKAIPPCNEAKNERGSETTER